MKILALDTSSEVASVALMEDKNTLLSMKSHDKKTHSQLLLPIISEALSSCGLIPEDIDVFAAVAGPGSFTGLRIGVTTVKALAYSLGKKVAAVNSLDSLALNVNGRAGLICPIIEARNDSVFTSVYRSTPDFPEKIHEYSVIHIDKLLQLIKQNDEDIIFTGNGLKNYKQFFEANLKDKFVPCSEEDSEANAVSAGLLAYRQISTGESLNCFELNAFYMRPSQAERLFKNGNFSNDQK